MRTFLAFDIPDGIIAHARQLQDFLRTHRVRAKWVNPQTIHLTVVFLGDQPDDLGERLTPALDLACSNSDPITMQLGDIETFGRPPRVLFLNLTPKPREAFALFTENIQQTLVDSGIQLPDTASAREPKAHVTLARFRHGREAATLKPLRQYQDNTWHWTTEPPQPPRNQRKLQFSELILYKSTLHPDGARYEALQHFPLSQTE